MSLSKILENINKDNENQKLTMYKLKKMHLRICGKAESIFKSPHRSTTPSFQLPKHTT